jgi:hypothetical protein
VNAQLRGWLVRLVPVAVIASAIAWGPHLVWSARPAHHAKIVILDKTIPFRNYREHAAFSWLLHALKVVAPSGRYYQEGRDYLGYDPIHKRGRTLTSADLDGADCLFIADTYGVYKGDYARPGDVAALERSPEIYGGMNADEAAAVRDYARRGGLAIAEFNAFASPTEDGPRATLESVFGTHWTRWVARYWPDLGNDEEVPQWLRRDYLRRYGEELEHHGSALIFVHEDDDIVVLRPGVDIERDVLVMRRTDAGDPDWPPRARYVYWLDVVEPAGATVVYEYSVAATEAGARQLEAHGLPRTFPAVLHGAGNAWYFAGDFVDTAAELGDPERAGLLAWRRLTRADLDTDESVLWGFYYPVLERLLEPAVRR